NKGLTLGTGDNAPPSYKSADSFSTDIPTKDPREPDGAKTFTHKMFYSFPDVNMPASAKMPARTTWLNPPKIVPTVTNITIMGNEGTEDRIGTKGGAFDFETNMAGTYKISITTGGGFVQRNLTGFAELGANSVFWDGRDGAGNPMVPGTADITVNVQLQGAEVHFPLVDVEHNANGMIIEQLNDDGSVKSDIVYWDDSEIVSTSTHPSNPLVNGNDGLGISSNLNGHKWSSHFG